MMKERFLLLLLTLISIGGMSAQEKAAKSYTVETNRFWNNWFISAGAGAQMYVGDNDGKAGFGNRISPALDINVGKWFTPVLGLRLGYNGLQAKGASRLADGQYTNGSTYPNGFYKQKWNLAVFHAEAMANISNLFWGYKEERIYSLIPYLGVGLAHSWDTPTEENFGLNAGLINRFRLSSVVDLNVELRGIIMKNAFGGTRKEGLAGLTVGVTYKFRQSNWKKPASTAGMVPESQLDGLRDRISALKSENDALKRDLVAERNRKPETVVQKEVTPLPRLVVVFNIGKSRVAKKEYMNIEATAKAIKERAGKVFTITGYADKSTGSTEYNMKLSKKRAEAVRDLLIKEFGVSDSQLKVDYKGGVDNMFYNQASLSRVAIVEE
jgi:outer membrane protein OmpA-like peptidoglycan-associated protein